MTVFTAQNRMLEICRSALTLEAQAISTYAESLGDEFLLALDVLAQAQDPIVVAGVGKSGHIARKVASTLRSIGKPAVFLHAAEASHGDLGLVGPKSAALVLSNSGETTELADLLHYCDINEIPIVAITSNAESTLGKMAAVALAYGKVKEACPNGLAPTTSTTLSLAICDALSVALIRLLETSPEDFRRYHPGGRLGAKLLRVQDVMQAGAQLPIVSAEVSMQETVITMSEKGYGVALVSQGDAIIGIITDGDMRRSIDRLWQSSAGDLVIGRPQAIAPDALASQAMEIMTMKGISCLLVEDAGGRVLGLVRLHDCLRAGVGQ